MDEPGKLFAPELSAAQSRQWIGRLLIAVVLGLALWNFVVSLTTALILPGLARIMEAEPQSPMYLGSGDFHFAGFFAAVLELCLALIAALIVSSWAQRRARVVHRRVRGTATVAPSILPSTPAPPARPPAAEDARVPRPVEVRSAAVPAIPEAAAATTNPGIAAPAPKPSEPVKPKGKKPKEVYYNIVGEPIDPDE